MGDGASASLEELDVVGMRQASPGFVSCSFFSPFALAYCQTDQRRCSNQAKLQVEAFINTMSGKAKTVAIVKHSIADEISFDDWRDAPSSRDCVRK